MTALPDTDTASRITAAIGRLNDTHGRGKLLAVDHERRVFTVRGLGHRVTTREYRLSPDGRQVFACGHWQEI